MMAIANDMDFLKQHTSTKLIIPSIPKIKAIYK